MKARIEKVVSQLPATLEKNTVYYLRVANGFDIYVTNNAGTIIAYPANYAAKNHTHAEYVSISDSQFIYGQKNYWSYSGGNWYNNTLVAYSDGSANPAVSFFKKGIDAAQLVYTGAVFHFTDSVSNNYVPVKANGFRKNSLTDDYFLLAGGGHVLKTDVALTHTHTYLENKNYDQLADLNTYLEAGRMKYQPAVLQGSPNLFPTLNNANGILSVATWKDKAFGHDLGFSSNGHIYHRYKGDETQYGWNKMLTDAGPDGVLLNRGNVFKDNSDANNFPAYSEIISIETPNGSGNINFPFEDYGTWTRIRSQSFVTDIAHRHNGELFHKNWYAFSNPAGYPWRRVWDSENFNPDNYISLDKGIKVDIQGGINNGSAGRANTAWFDYNWAGTGGSGSVINFSGLPGGRYSVEIFAEYKDYGENHIGYRVYNGDNNTWGLHKWLWHTDNFNPSNYLTVADAGNQYVTIGTSQSINARKSFRGATGNAYDNCAIGIDGNGAANTIFPTIAFHQPGLYAATLSYRGGSGFFFKDLNADGAVNINANGFLKAGSDNNFLLAGGGGHYNKSDFQPAGSYIKNGGQNTTSNNIFLGWTGSELQLTVDATVIGNFATQNWVSTNYQPAGNYATQTWVSANYAAKNHTHPEYQPAGNYITQSGLDSQLGGYATETWVNNNFISDSNLTKEIKIENSEVRLTPFDLIVYSNFNMFDTDNRLVYVTLSDGGDIVMKNIFRFQNIHIMNTSDKFGVFKVDNTNIAIEIESHTTMNAYVNGDGRLINISAGTAYLF